MDLDEVQMPGTYPGDPSSSQPLPATTIGQPEHIDPAIRLRRTRKRPAHFRDILPETPVAVPPKPQLPMVYLMVTNPLTTALNTFGVFRKYLFHPSYDPDSVVDPGDLSNLGPPTPPPSLESNSTDYKPPWPFSNMSVWRLVRWMNTGSRSKSEGEVNRLVNEVLKAPDFRVEDIHDFNAHRAHGRLDAAKKKSNPLDDDFQVTSVTIEVPTGERNDSGGPRLYSVPGLRFRKLLNVIKAAFQDPLSRHFHFTPFSLMHRSPVTGAEQRLYSELYHSDAFIKEHNRVQNRSQPPPDDPGCKLEKVIAALMFWSDSTHLTNFGTAKLWPIYLFFGNLSKYIRSRPSSGACNHLAYIPSVCTSPVSCLASLPTNLQLPDSFTTWISGWHPHWETQRDQLMAHCRRELTQAVWKYILDDDFIHAMIYGVVVTCYDGVKRRIYPRIFTYSADYPEKCV